MIHVPSKFQPTINTVYPHENREEYERWFFENYKGDVSDREYLPILFCAYHVNNSYGQDKRARYDLQAFVDSLPANKKYFCLSQYDDGVGVDFKGKDVLIFDMSKPSAYQIPLMCEPHSYVHDGSKKYFASFVGSRTHELRDSVFALQYSEGYYISGIKHDINHYCKIIAQSIFGLCPRGYGFSSFRIIECMQYGTIPVFISDEFIFPHNLDFLEYGVIIEAKDAGRIDEILKAITPEQIIHKQDRIQQLYRSHFSYEGCQQKIIEHLCLPELSTMEAIREDITGL